MLTIKQKLMLDTFKKMYKILQTQDTILTQDYCKNVVKVTVQHLYKMFPDKNFGKLSVNWFDSQGNKPEHIDENNIECFEICFHSQEDNKPWLISRFYKKDPKVRIYVCQ